MISEKEVDCVIFFYQKGKSEDHFVLKECVRKKLKEKQDLAELKSEIR